ncbi:MAG: hypothetical protein IPM35_18745 [Myxococcales bacterium]|nr:hypothetical protein [Myxococcales bacterium]
MSASSPASEQRARWATRLVLGYLGLSVAAAAYLRAATFSLRALEPTRLDTAWQLELVFLADQGVWSGRDFHYARGPLWQALTWLAKGGPFAASPAQVIAAMEASHMLLGIAASVWLTWRVVQSGWARVVALVALALVSYAAGISTLRAMLSVAIVVSYLPDGEAPSFRKALLPAALTTFGLLYSFDRVPLALSAVSVAVAAEAIARFRRRERVRPALSRGGWYVAALAATLGAAVLLGLAVGANPLAYVPEQRRIATAYGALWTGWEAGVRPANIVALGVAAAVLAGIPLLRRSGRWVEPVWVLSVLPAASFAAIVTDQGHVFVGIAPLLVVLVLWAARQAGDDASAPRIAAALLAAVAFAGWFGSYRDALWLRPRNALAALHALRHGAADDGSFTTDITPAAEWVEKRRGALPCIALAPGLTIVHALSRVSGPTLLTLRWTEAQQRERARALDAAACPYYVHELLAFEDPRGSDWLLGEDFVTIAETYAPHEAVGAASLVLARRGQRALAERRELPSPATGQRLAFDAPGEVAIPLGASVRGEQLVALDYTLEVPEHARWVGALPGIEFRFEAAGVPVSEYRQFFHAAVGRRVHSMASADAAAAEWRWIAGRPPLREVSADTLRLRFRRQGRLSPEHGELLVHSVSVLSPPALPPSAPAAECTPKLDFTQELERGRALPRNVAPRLAGRGFELHPNPPPLHVAEIFFDVRPCEDAACSPSSEVRAPAGQRATASISSPLARPVGAAAPARGARRARHTPAGGGGPLALGGAERDAALRHQERPGHAERLRRGVPRRFSAAAARAHRHRRRHPRRLGMVSGSFELSGMDVSLPAETREIRYRARVSKDTCFTTRASGPSTVETYVVVDGIAHRVDKRRIREDAQAFGPIGLHDWEGRDVELVLKSVPEAGAKAGVVLHGAELARCPRAP